MLDLEDVTWLREKQSNNLSVSLWLPSLYTNSISSEYLLQEGLVALWRGWVPSVIGVIPYVGLNFAVYESLKDVVLQATGNLPLQVLLMCYPFLFIDFIKNILIISDWAISKTEHCKISMAALKISDARRFNQESHRPVALLEKVCFVLLDIAAKRTFYIIWQKRFP